jgi:hypothetical protein
MVIQTAVNILAQKGKSFKNTAGELALVFHTLRQKIINRSMDCQNKLSKDIFHDSDKSPVAEQKQRLLGKMF